MYFLFSLKSLCSFLFLTPFIATSLFLNPDVFQKHSKDWITKNYNSQFVKVRGFIHCNNQGKWFLSPLPKIKSCCQNKDAVLSQSILLSDFTPQQSEPKGIYTLKGYFHVEEFQNPFSYSLTSIKIIPNSTKIPWTAITITSLLVILLKQFFKRKNIFSKVK
jgi:hypothetical protein